MAKPRPGDRIVVQIFGDEPRAADTLTISDRGQVVLPKLGPVDVTAFTIGAVPDTLRARYARFLRNPTVDVLVLRRIAVNGEVKKPDIYYIDASTMLPDAIAHAGGITESGNRNKISILRGGQEIAVTDWDKPNSPNTELMSGDLISVGRRSWLSQNVLPAVSALALVASILLSLRK